MSTRKILVVGLGNPDRGDDGVGAVVVRALKGRLPEEVKIIARSGDMLSLMDDWAGFDALVFVDAAAATGAAGRIRRIDVAAEELPADLAVTSSHAMGLAEVIALARTLDLAPPEIIIYAVEGARFEGGAPMMPEVSAAAKIAADRIIAEVTRLGQS